MSTRILEQGPPLLTTMPDFRLPDCDWKAYELGNLMGETGLLLAFIGDIWHPASVRRVMWLQHHTPKFATLGTPVAIIVRDEAKMLYGFQTSSPLPIPFPLLADTKGDVHDDYDMVGLTGLLLLDKQHRLQAKWIIPEDRVWVKLPQLVSEIELLKTVSVY
ncbi:MAG: redoxin domain-containing protein [Anaerolineae bacterium]|nr:redoxin domain-containing protein [Anaerolineae bacterium]